MTIEQRIARLERSANRWRIACICTIVLAIVIGAGEGVSEEVRTRSLVVVNKAGNPAAILDTSSDGFGELMIYGPANGGAITLSAGDKSNGLTMDSPDGQYSVELDANNRSGANLGLQSHGKFLYQAYASGILGRTVIRDANEKKVWSAPPSAMPDENQLVK
jgi:hypothetical protein